MLDIKKLRRLLVSITNDSETALDQEQWQDMRDILLEIGEKEVADTIMVVTIPD